MLISSFTILFQPKQSIPKLKHPTLAFTKYADTVAPIQSSSNHQQQNGFQKIPGIGTYRTGHRIPANHNNISREEYYDTKKELSDIRRHEIPKNHNTPTNEREFTWDKEQQKMLPEEKRKDLKRFSKSQDSGVNRSDIDSFDYRNLRNGTSNKKSPRNNNFLPHLSETLRKSSETESRNAIPTNEKQRTPRRLGEFSRQATKSFVQSVPEEINPDVVQLDFKEPTVHKDEPKKPTKSRKSRRGGDIDAETEGHLRYQNGVLQPKKSYKG